MTHYYVLNSPNYDQTDTSVPCHSVAQIGPNCHSSTNNWAQSWRLYDMCITQVLFAQAISKIAQS